MNESEHARRGARAGRFWILRSTIHEEGRDPGHELRLRVQRVSAREGTIAVVSSATCIYCQISLGADTRVAHIIPSALGGKLASRNICCWDCNSAISAIEKSLCDALRGVTAMAGVQTGRGRKAPPLRMTDPQHGLTEVWGGHPTIMGTPPAVRPPEGGQVRFHFSATDLDSAALQTAHLLRRFGKTPDDLEAGKVVTFTGAERITFLDRFEFDGSISLPEHLRVFAKAALELLALHRPLLALRPELRDAAAFVRFGGPEVDVGWDATTEGPLGVVRPLWHSCEVWSAGANLIGKVVLFGAYPFTVSLTTKWQGEPVTAVHAVDPVAGRVLLNAASSEDGPLPRGWPNRVADLDALQLRLNELARALDARMHDVTVKRCSKDLMERWRREIGGREPCPQDFVRLQTLVDEECERLRSRRTETAPLSTPDLFRLVRQHFERLEREHGPAPA